MAALVGAPHYFSGVPCCHGHLAPRRTLNGVCLICHRLEDRRRAGFSINGGENPDQLTFKELVAGMTGLSLQCTDPKSSTTLSSSIHPAGSKSWQLVFPFYLLGPLWENL